jgi:transcription elongation GreA/GreB family factor
VNKSDLRDAIIRHLRDELGRQTAAATMARDEAISEESRAESKWDTHSQEAAYLAEGQARLAAEIGAGIELYATLPLPDFGPGDPAAIGALVELEIAATKSRSWYFIGPRAGGAEVQLESRNVLVVTPQSPLGRQLIGRRVGDTIAGPGRTARNQRIVTLV